MKGNVFMTVLAIVGVLATGCGGETVGYVEEFKEKTQVPADWHPHGLVYMREDKEMGLVLCFGGTGEMLPKGVDSIAISLEVPSEGAIIEFEYKVYAAAGDLAYFLVKPAYKDDWKAWMDRKEATDWETASFVVSEPASFQLSFVAKRAEAGSTGCAVCIDNFRIRKASVKEREPFPLPTQ